MTEFRFAVTEISAERRSVSPMLRFHMRVQQDGEPVDALSLRVQVQIEPASRGYAPDEELLLAELFGTRERWSSTARPLQWHEASVMLGRITDEAEFDLSVPCTYDMEVASSKYLIALDDGTIPVRLLFNGTAFRGAQSGFQVEMLPWELDCTTRVPVKTWREAMDARFPRKAWIRMDEVTFDALCRYRAQHGLLDWDATFAHMLTACEESAHEVSQG